MPHVFISYMRENIDFAENVSSRLEREGFAIWADSKIAAGEEWRTAIDTAIKNAFALIVIMTPDAKASEYVTYEWAFAWGIGIRVIPIMLRSTELHPRLEALQYLDFTNSNSRPWEKLIEQLRGAVSTPLARSVGSSDDPFPFIRQAVASLNSASVDDRREAIANLVSARTPAAQTVLIEALKHPFPDVRSGAAKALAGIKDPASVRALIEALKDSEKDIRRGAALSLGKIKDPTAAPALTEMLKDPESVVRSATAEALGWIGDHVAVPALIEALKDSEKDVRRTAVYARELSRIRPPCQH